MCHYLDDKEAAELIRVVMEKASHPFDMIVILLLHTGMRRGECCGLKWEDIDFENSKVIDTVPEELLNYEKLADKLNESFATDLPGEEILDTEKLKELNEQKAKAKAEEKTAAKKSPAKKTTKKKTTTKKTNKKK